MHFLHGARRNKLYSFLLLVNPAKTWDGVEKLAVNYNFQASKILTEWKIASCEQKSGVAIRFNWPAHSIIFVSNVDSHYCQKTAEARYVKCTNSSLHTHMNEWMNDTFPRKTLQLQLLCSEEGSMCSKQSLPEGLWVMTRSHSNWSWKRLSTSIKTKLRWKKVLTKNRRRKTQHLFVRRLICEVYYRYHAALTD